MLLFSVIKSESCKIGRDLHGWCEQGEALPSPVAKLVPITLKGRRDHFRHPQ